LGHGPDLEDRILPELWLFKVAASKKYRRAENSVGSPPQVNAMIFLKLGFRSAQTGWRKNLVKA
jgi:hypothetical protein